MDGSLSLVSPFLDLLHFKHGWWESGNTAAISGVETLAHLYQLPFAYADSDAGPLSNSGRSHALETS